MLRRSFLASLAVGLASCTGSQAVPAAEPVVDSIGITGCANVEEAKIRSAIQSLHAGEPFDAAKLEADRKAILALGYFRSVAAQQQTQNGKVRIQFRVVEWPKVTFIRVFGNTVVDQRAIRAAISTQVGQVFSAPQLQSDIQAIERLYRDEGYVARVAESILDEATRSGILRFEILELRIAEVTMEGGDAEMRRRADAVLQERAPALYRPGAVSKDQRRLEDVRGVKHALARVEVTSPGQVRIRWFLNPPPEMREQMPR